MVMTQSQPHALQNVTDVLTLVSFAFLCYAVYRVFRRPQSRTRAWALGLMTALLAVATLFDAIIEHRVVITFNSLYLSQVSFAVVIIAVSLGLRGESLRVERELQRYRTHMDELVEARVQELDEAHARLAEEERERSAARRTCCAAGSRSSTRCSASRRSSAGARPWSRRWTRSPAPPRACSGRGTRG